MITIAVFIDFLVRDCQDSMVSAEGTYGSAANRAPGSLVTQSRKDDCCRRNSPSSEVHFRILGCCSCLAVVVAMVRNEVTVKTEQRRRAKETRLMRANKNAGLLYWLIIHVSRLYSAMTNNGLTNQNLGVWQISALIGQAWPVKINNVGNNDITIFVYSNIIIRFKSLYTSCLDTIRTRFMTVNTRKPLFIFH